MEKAVNENAIGNEVLSGAMKVHTSLGPGLLESVYELCLVYELSNGGLKAAERMQAWLPPQLQHSAYA